MRIGWLAVVGVGCGHPDGDPPVSADLPPNFIVVVIDDVGIDKVASYGVHPDTAPTPTFDRLADEGLRFTNAFAMPTCTATRAALLTGRHTFRTRTGGIIWPFETEWELPLDEVALPEVLAEGEMPYDSALAGKWHLSSNVSPSSTFLPMRQGFGWFSGSMNNLWVDSEAQTGGYGFYAFEKVQPDGTVEIERQYATIDTTDDAIDRLAALVEPFLLVVSYNGAHNPWHTPPDDLHSFGEAPTRFEQHLAATEAVDRELGRLVDELSPALRARTYLVVMGDNGTPGTVTTDPSDPDQAKGTLAEGGVRVPFVVTGPGVPAGRETEALISVVDVWPTLADLAGLDADERPAAGPVDGVSQVDVWHGEAATARDRVYLERLSHTGPGPWDIHDRAVRDDRYKLVRTQAGSESLFEFATDVLDDGPNLLDAPLTEDAALAYLRLAAELDE